MSDMRDAVLKRMSVRGICARRSDCVHVSCSGTSEVLAAVGLGVADTFLWFLLKAPSVAIGARCALSLSPPSLPTSPLDGPRAFQGGAPLAAKRRKEFNCAKSPVR